jgi:hypothetical protein
MPYIRSTFTIIAAIAPSLRIFFPAVKQNAGIWRLGAHEVKIRPVIVL